MVEEFGGNDWDSLEINDTSNAINTLEVSVGNVLEEKFNTDEYTHSLVRIVGVSKFSKLFWELRSSGIASLWSSNTEWFNLVKHARSHNSPQHLLLPNGVKIDFTSITTELYSDWIDNYIDEL